MRLVSRRSLLALASAAASCVARSPTPGRRMADLQLLAHLERAGDALLLHYSVENNAARDAYLLNRVHDQSLQTTSDFVYIDFDRERRLVSAYKKVPAIPAGMAPTMPAAPYVTPLRAGQRFSETLRIALPVHEYSAYAPLPENGQPASYRGLRFTLGYYWSLPGMKERTQQIIPGVEALVTTPPPGSPIEFGELQSDVMPSNIPVVETVRP
jgi:hypothetical protein